MYGHIVYGNVMYGHVGWLPWEPLNTRSNVNYMTKWQVRGIIGEFGINKFTGTKHLFSTFESVGGCSIYSYRAWVGVNRPVKLNRVLSYHIGDRRLREPLRAWYSESIIIPCQRNSPEGMAYFLP